MVMVYCSEKSVALLDDRYEEAPEPWLESYKTTAKESSYSKTKIIFGKHIYPKFGNIKLSKINTAYCQKG